MRHVLSATVLCLGLNAAAQTPPAAAPAAPAAPAAAPAAPAAPAAKAWVRPVPLLKPDKDGFCQQTDFIGWAKDGGEAAYAESFCDDPPPDQAFDTLFFVTRDGRVKRWIGGPESAPTLKPDTRAKLLFGDSIRKPGTKSDDGVTANAKIEGDYLLVTFTAAKKEDKAPPPVSHEAKLPYARWETTKGPTVGEIFWAPGGGALVVTIKATKKNPKGGSLNVAAMNFIEFAPPKPPSAPTATAPGGPGMPPGMPAGTPPGKPMPVPTPAAVPAPPK